MFSILALGGGGLKGYLEIGAIEELEEHYGKLHETFHEGVYGCSIGSIIATCIAFGIDVATIKKYFMDFASIKDLFGNPDFSKITKTFTNKGIYEMNSLDTFLINKFKELNIDIKNKVLGDALIPLHITASNITKGIPTIFQKNVPVLDAIRASSCIPFLFQPQVINTSVYIDGGFLTNILLNIIPKEKRERTLSVSIIHKHTRITPKSLHQINPIEYAYRLYKTTCVYERYMNIHKNNIDLYYSGGSGISTFSEKEKEDMILIGKTLTAEFLRTKCTD